MREGSQKGARSWTGGLPLTSGTRPSSCAGGEDKPHTPPGTPGRSSACSLLLLAARKQPGDQVHEHLHKCGLLEMPGNSSVSRGAAVHPLCDAMSQPRAATSPPMQSFATAASFGVERRKLPSHTKHGPSPAADPSLCLRWLPGSPVPGTRQQQGPGTPLCPLLRAGGSVPKAK